MGETELLRQCGTELESPQTSSLWSFCSHFWATRDIFDVPISLAFSCRADLARILLSWFSPKDWKFYRNLKKPVAFHTNKLVLWNIAYSFIYTLKDIILFGIDRKLSKIPITTRTTTPALMQAIGYWFTHAGQMWLKHLYHFSQMPWRGCESYDECWLAS